MNAFIPRQQRKLNHFIPSAVLPWRAVPQRDPCYLCQQLMNLILCRSLLSSPSKLQSYPRNIRKSYISSLKLPAVPTVTCPDATLALSSPAECSLDNSAAQLCPNGYYCWTTTKRCCRIQPSMLTSDSILALSNPSLVCKNSLKGFVQMEPLLRLSQIRV